MSKPDELRILWVASELDPIAKVGGLGDVSHGLPKALHESGIDIRVMIPKYGFLNTEELGFERVFKGNFSFIDGEVTLWKGKLVKDDVIIYLLGHELFEGDSIYPDADKEGFETEGKRFLLLSRMAVHIKEMTGWAPNLFHANDWHTATLPAFVKAFQPCKKRPIGTVLTIHNIAFQGPLSPQLLEKFGLSQAYYSDLIENGKVKVLRLGIKYADKITTVSPSYAKEIIETELGFGLQEDLKKRKNDVIGILNGIDTEEYDPETDESIPQNFSPKDLSGKQICKKVLQKSYGLEQKPESFLLGMIARISEQKGFDLVAKAVPELSKHPIQIVILGEGHKHLKEQLKQVEKEFPETLSLRFGYDFRLARLIYAGTDGFLVPSRYEPCGLTQMYAMRYGSVPIAHKTGGLADTVFDSEEFRTGFLFENYEVDEFVKAVLKAYNIYAFDKEKWSYIVKVAMSQDHSWKNRVNEWKKLYQEIISKKRRIILEKTRKEKSEAIQEENESLKETFQKI